MRYSDHKNIKQLGYAACLFAAAMSPWAILVIHKSFRADNVQVVSLNGPEASKNQQAIETKELPPLHASLKNKEGASKQTPKRVAQQESELALTPKKELQRLRVISLKPRAKQRMDHYREHLKTSKLSLDLYHKFLNSLPSEREKLLWTTAYHEHLASTRGDAAWEQVLSESPGIQRHHGVLAYLHELSSHDVTRAAKLIDSLADEELRTDAQEIVSLAWFERDFDEAVNWIDRLHIEEQKRLFPRVVAAVTKDHRLQTQRWIASIRDMDMKAEGVHQYSQVLSTTEAFLWTPLMSDLPSDKKREIFEDHIKRVSNPVMAAHRALDVSKDQTKDQKLTPSEQSQINELWNRNPLLATERVTAADINPSTRVEILLK